MKHVPVQANRAIETVSWLFTLARDWCRRDITPIVHRSRICGILMDEQGRVQCRYGECTNARAHQESICCLCLLTKQPDMQLQRSVW